MSKMIWVGMGAAAMLASSLPLSAMTLATRGVGQVLEYPYYSVNGNQDTLLAIVNTSPHGKAVKARFREAYDGRVVAQFNVYLSPYDVWAADVFDDHGTVAIGTNDNSCTVPSFDRAATSVGIPALAFSTSSFTGANGDTGPTDTARMKEGHFEFF